MTPVDELKAAAEKLRALAAEASEGPWTANQWGNVETAAYEEVAEVWPLQAKPDVNVTYIAAMHPGVGAALATLLERQAKQAAEIEQYLGDQFQDGALDQDVHDALAVARQILGTQP